MGVCGLSGEMSTAATGFTNTIKKKLIPQRSVIWVPKSGSPARSSLFLALPFRSPRGAKKLTCTLHRTCLSSIPYLVNSTLSTDCPNLETRDGCLVSRSSQAHILLGLSLKCGPNLGHHHSLSADSGSLSVTMTIISTISFLCFSLLSSDLPSVQPLLKIQDYDTPC